MSKNLCLRKKQIRKAAECVPADRTDRQEAVLQSDIDRLAARKAAKKLRRKKNKAAKKIKMQHLKALQNVG